MSNIIDKLEVWFSQQSIQQRLVYLGFVGVFIAIFTLNYFFPIYADDWIYSFVWDNANVDSTSRVSGIMDIFHSQYLHYFRWGGRIIAHVFAQFFLMFPPIVFDIINSILFLFFIGLIYKIALSNRKHNFSLLLLIVIGMWFFQPSFSFAVIWLTGSCNYLWCTFIIILFLYPYIRLYEGKLKLSKTKQSFLTSFMLICGIVAGWTNENTSVALVFLLFCLLIVYRVEKINVPLWGYLGLLGAIIGCALLLLAPGNTERALVEGGNAKEIGLGFTEILAIRLDLLYYSYLKFTLAPALLFLAAVLYKLLFNREKTCKKDFVLPFLFFVAAHVAFVAMIGAPIFPPRVVFGVNTFLIIGIAMIYANLDFEFKIIKLANVLGIILAFGYFMYSYFVIYERLVIMDRVFTAREKKIEKSKAKGVLNIEFDDPLVPHKKLDLFDLCPDSTQWQNVHYSKFYGVNSVKCISSR